MPRQPKTTPYGFWTGLFDIKALFEKPPLPMYPCARGNRLFWLETRTEQAGRVVLMQRYQGTQRCLTPKGFSLRSRVHEYGGCPYTIHEDTCYFVNDADQRIYSQALDDDLEPVARTPASDRPRTRYIDLCITGDATWLVCVMEHEAEPENRNMLAAVRLEPGALHEPRIVRSDADFYANPILDTARQHIAWIQWHHPNMPWDRSEAMIASYSTGADGVELENIERVVGGDNTSVCQLGFDDDGDLLLAIDGDGAPGQVRDYWNLYRWCTGGFTQLTFDEREYGAPHWVFGERRYAVLNDHLVAVRTGRDGDELVVVDKHGGGARPVASGAVDIRQVARAGPDEALMIAAWPTHSPALTIWRDPRLTVIDAPGELLPKNAMSRATAIEFASDNGARTHAYYYPPRNPNCRAPGGEKPPLIVMMHGGPTARCSSALDLTRQYWTTLGFAVLDVNYRGSTGYGRGYRQALLGEWGRVDIQDAIAGIEYLVQRGWIDRHRVFIRGRSAGGYAVLSALTAYPNVFAAGACYYGIGNLSTLAQHTHKFESRYTDRLIGEAYKPAAATDPNSRFVLRSPIHYVSAINCPVIVFQGLEDKVVPPEVSREIARALKEHGLEHEYIEYPGEGHGFRSKQTNIDALERETAFYRRVLNAAAEIQA